MCDRKGEVDRKVIDFSKIQKFIGFNEDIKVQYYVLDDNFYHVKVEALIT